MKQKKKSSKVEALRSKFFKFSTLVEKEKVLELLELLKEDYGDRLLYFGAFRHSKDKYDKQDNLLNEEHKIGELKPLHFHISIVFNQEIRLGTI